MQRGRYQIGEVAETLGLSVRTIRHWEEERCAGLRTQLGAAREIARRLRPEVSGRRTPGTMAQ